ncbi:hypothetical protein ACFLRA_00840 [Bdellovibrionota bacterium]
MKKQLTILSLIICAILGLSFNASAGVDDVMKLLDDNEAVISAKREVRASFPLWYPRFGTPEVTVVQHAKHAGNIFGGNGTETKYLVRIPYDVQMDWNDKSDGIFIFVSEWDLDEINLGEGEVVPASKGTKIDKIVTSVDKLLEN